MDLSIIIVNYNCGKLINGCLASINIVDFSLKTQIIIVDNNSTDGSKEIVLNSFPEVLWIEMGYNAGFARANNEGIKSALAPVILLLNPDTLIINDAINNAYGEFVKSLYVACGLQLLNEDGTPQISGNYAMKGGLNFLLPLPFMGNFLKKVASLFHVKPPSIPDAKSTEEVDWINGAFLMVKKSAISKAGILDPDFFLYAEEAEWCSRLKRVGPLCIYGQYKVIHLQGYSSNKSFQSVGQGYMNLFDRKGLQIMVSNLVRIRKEFGKFWFIVILSLYVIEIPVFILGTMMNKILGKGTYNFYMVKNYINNVGYVLKLSPVIIANKNYFYKIL